MCATKTQLLTSKVLRSSPSNLKDIILRTEVKHRPPLEPEIHTKCIKQISSISKKTPKLTLSADLFEQYNKEFARVSPNELSKVNSFFNSSMVKFEWACSSFLAIPGENLKRDIKLRQKEEEKLIADTANFIDSIKVPGSSPVFCDDDHLPKKPRKRYPGKTDGIPFELLNGLPEVAFLGRCNSGKSTLLNNLTTGFQRVKLNAYARASRRPGFTKTINCFNVGNKLRLIDTPGYGVKGTKEQGTLTMDYLRERKELRRTFVLISADLGFTPLDTMIIDFLVTHGIPFELVFTKMDKVKNVKRIHSIIQNSGILNLPVLPQITFLNSTTNKQFQKRYGVDQLRYLIFQACNLKPGTLPSKSAKL
ncbi:translation initiation/elongation factor MRX8 Ecym_8017 [Eremothecium cymbalariae DBVPG|uniref:EngB-type G domain-containing protein n=1 Tax=Eremothecium cymbalariae (strain CBS 270.75 / DBVPG 7215 / KCTC 17166 / NRRL Y-17582) TaxID=931890 RepID=G8JWT9_ERECY|nr:Hypothetical protein Ecym_8017 [Eremothecium cymbalariae DBVPG\